MSPSGPEIEDDFHNFGRASNIPRPDHPGRRANARHVLLPRRAAAAQPTTSPVQIRAACSSTGPPLAVDRALGPRPIRCDSEHDPFADVSPARGSGGGARKRQLRQHEGGAARLFCRPFFEARSGHAGCAPRTSPFTEPSGGSGHVVRGSVTARAVAPASNSGWLEISGCGNGASRTCWRAGERCRPRALHRLRLRRRGSIRLAMLRYGRE